jgi:hypothetical protein
MSVRVPGFALGGRAEHRGHIVVTLYIGFLCEIEVTAIGLRFAGERGFQIFFGLAALELRHILPPLFRNAGIVPVGDAAVSVAVEC